MVHTLVSWNIDSLNAALLGKSSRSTLSLKVVETIRDLDPDVVAIQETKLNGDQKKSAGILKALMRYFPDYQEADRRSEPPARTGYAGTLMLYRKSLPEPTVTRPRIGAPDTMDDEGRMLTLEFPDCFVTTVYTPNSGSGLVRLKPRGIWDDCYRRYLRELDARKPVLACGDFNVAHEEIDIANPASNHHSAGFTDQEREKFSLLLDAGFTDTFRKIHGDAAGFYDDHRSVYTWFAQRAPKSKINNSGWRIDYWLTSNRIADQVSTSEPVDTGERQDHLPILLRI